MNMELVRESQISFRKPYLLMGIVLLIAAFLPNGMEKHQIFLILFASVIPATYTSDRSDWSKLITAVIFAIGFLLIKGMIFEIHTWQLTWEYKHTNGLFGWQWRIDPLLNSIPFNDGMWLRQFKSPLFDSILVPIYVYGFTTPLLVLLVYYLLSHRGDKIIHALFCAHAVQYIIMLPFHFWVDGHQVWMVQNIYDGTSFMDPIMAHRSHGIPTIPSLNHVFPSMHSSVATAMILLAWRERSQLLKWSFTIFNVLVIVSTIYLGIHWIVDMIAGVLLGWSVVKFGDWAIKRKVVKNFISGSENLVRNLLNRKKSQEAYEDTISF